MSLTDKHTKICIQKGCSQEKKTDFPMKHFILLSMGILEIVSGLLSVIIRQPSIS